MRNFDPLKQYNLFTPNILPDRPLILLQKCPISIDSAHIDTDCIPNTVFRPYLHLSKIFGHPLIDKALKLYTTLASQELSYSDLLFLTAQTATSNSKKKQNRSQSNTNSQSVFYAQLNSYAKVEENLFWNWTC